MIGSLLDPTHLALTVLNMHPNHHPSCLGALELWVPVPGQHRCMLPEGQQFRRDVANWKAMGLLNLEWSHEMSPERRQHQNCHSETSRSRSGLIQLSFRHPIHKQFQQ